MKKVLFPAILAFAISGSAFASLANQANNLCASGPGHWSGTFTLKDEALCQQFGGCTHYVQADLSELGGNRYLIDLQPSVGTGGKAPLTCDNGKVTSEYLPGAVAYINCFGADKCSVDYEDARLISHMRKKRA